MVAVEWRRVEVKQHSYDTAWVGGHFFRAPRRLFNELEAALAEKAGRPPDNKTVYEVSYTPLGKDKQEITYIWFFDTEVIFGRTIQMQRQS
jgi:hypothetical protein